MPSPFEKYRKDLIPLLLQARKNDPWSRERIIAELGISINNQTEMNGFKNYIRDLIKGAEEGSSLSVVSNDGKGYYLPEFEDEYENLKNRRINTAKGFARSAKKYKAHMKNAKKRFEQITIENLGEFNFEGN